MNKNFEQMLRLVDYVDGLMVVDKNCIIRHYYTAYPDLVNLRQDEPLNRRLFEIYPTLKREDSYICRALKTGESFINYEQTYINYKGDAMDANCSAVPIKEHGEVVGDTPFFFQVIEGIETTCRDAGYRLQLFYFNEVAPAAEQIELINNSGCSGVILLGTEMFLEDYRPFQSLHVPLVVLDSYYDELPFTTVLINNARGAFLATNYLVSEGHRNIGYLQSARAISNFEERADGFFRALRQNEIKKNMSYVFRVTPVQGVAYREFSRILDTHPALPTGFFADNDIIALDCIRALKEHGYRIPDDVSVVGFDDIPSCQLLEPPMTTTCVPKSFLGAQAMHQLLRLFADPILPPVKVEISTELVKRSTVRRLS